MRRHDGALTGGPVPPATPTHGQSGAYEYLTGPGGAPADPVTGSGPQYPYGQDPYGQTGPQGPGGPHGPGGPGRGGDGRSSKGRTVAIGAAIALAAALTSGGVVYVLSARDTPAGGANPATSSAPQQATGEEDGDRSEQAGPGEEEAGAGEEGDGGSGGPADQPQGEPVVGSGGGGSGGGGSGGGSGGGGGTAGERSATKNRSTDGSGGGSSGGGRGSGSGGGAADDGPPYPDGPPGAIPGRQPESGQVVDIPYLNSGGGNPV